MAPRWEVREDGNPEALPLGTSGALSSHARRGDAESAARGEMRRFMASPYYPAHTGSLTRPYLARVVVRVDADGTETRVSRP